MFLSMFNVSSKNSTNCATSALSDCTHTILPLSFLSVASSAYVSTTALIEPSSHIVSNRLYIWLRFSAFWFKEFKAYKSNWEERPASIILVYNVLSRSISFFQSGFGVDFIFLLYESVSLTNAVFCSISGIYYPPT